MPYPLIFINMNGKAKTVCRTCEGTDALVNIFEDNEIAVKLMAIANIEIQKDDAFSQSICKVCLCTLESAYKFKLQCETLHIKFKTEAVAASNKYIELENQQSDNEDEKIPLSILKRAQKQKQKGTIKRSKQPSYDKKKFEETGLYECSNCKKLFDKHEDYLKHRRTHRRRPPCPICQKICSSTFTLKAHLRIHDKVDNARVHECKECSKKYTSKGNLDRHMRNHTRDFRHVCDMCGKCFIQSSTLRSHQLTHKKVGDLACQDCDKRFKYKANLVHHRETVHNDTKDSNAFHCEICKRRFFNERNLEWHLTTHTKPESQVKVKKEPDPTQYICPHCGKNFRTKGQVKLHYRTHTGEQPYECEVCHKRFKFQSNYKCHMVYHTGERPFACTLCNKTFRQATHLKTHAIVHTGEKPHKCNYCDKAFALNSNLKIHIRIHTGERPYVCTDCGQGFVDSNGLKKHMKKHFVQ